MDENQRVADSDKVHKMCFSPEHAVDPRVDLAVQRTKLALDRTLLAWVGTAFTLIAAGFAIDKGGQALHEARVLKSTSWVPTAHFSGIFLAAAATMFLLIASIAYFRQSHALARLKGVQPPRFSPVMAVSFLAIFLGGTLSVLLLIWS
jgi:uncharacterized membrane protein YidH (DUF202 family)